MVKMIDYTNDIYIDVFIRFYQALKITQRVFVAGYGFGDKGINTKLIGWIYTSPDNKIVLTHPNPESLRESARYAISKQWNKWVDENHLIIIPKKIEEITWQEIKEAFRK